MKNRTLNVGDIVLDKRYNIHEIVTEIDDTEDLIIVKSMFTADDSFYHYSFEIFDKYYQIVSSVGD